MEGAEWELYPSPYTSGGVFGCPSVFGEGDEHEHANLVSFEAILPEDILVKILSLLPVASLIRAGGVCKRWYSVVHSQRSTWRSMAPQNPWYFTYSCSEDVVKGFSFDPILRKWYSFDFPCIERSNWSASASSGLVCFMDSDNWNRILVCNPITREWRQLPDAPGVSSAEYNAIAISTSKKPQGYTVAVTRCSQVTQDNLRWVFSIHLYDSGSRQWCTPFSEVLLEWRGSDECVICNGVLYCLVISLALGVSEPQHSLVMYDLCARGSRNSLTKTAIAMPCPLTCGRLMNLKEKLILVGGIGKPDRPGIIKGIGIWELSGKAWHRITLMPHKLFQGFGEIDDVFLSSGAEDIIYIQSYGSPVLLTFDISKSLWKWATKSPLMKRFPLQLFSGFSFEPRLDMGT